MIEQAKLAYSPLGKAFEKQTEAIEEQGKKQVEALEDSDPEKNQKLKNDGIKNEIAEIKKWENKTHKKDLKYETNIYDFQQFETIRPFGDSIFTGKISINNVEMDQAIYY